MSRFINRKSAITLIIALTLVAAFVGGVALRGGGTPTRAATPVKNPDLQQAGRQHSGIAGGADVLFRAAAEWRDGRQHYDE